MDGEQRNRIRMFNLCYAYMRGWKHRRTERQKVHRVTGPTQIETRMTDSVTDLPPDHRLDEIVSSDDEI